jgi:hypothetical protein
MTPTHIARGIVSSGFTTSSAIEASIPVGLRQYAPWIKPSTNCYAGASISRTI